MLRDIYRESPAVQEWLAEGRAEGRLLTEQELVLSLLARRFPALVPELEPHMRALQDPDRLRALLLAFCDTFDPEAARALFLTTDL
ncbi:hypothetical protein [Thermogemmatispora onikobensis]|uniref:hypothetical protein n=1 Tax=Thermogemmatispora onikobensis TaxID=732234 RepID=UPI000852CBAD|nr:hypothetical protein [Thermogemmatispora onikobensis]